VVEFGPINASIHKIDEHIEIASLDVLKDVYRSTLDQLVR
jgi:succinyl-diaminopimelate desuccinylase